LKIPQEKSEAVIRRRTETLATLGTQDTVRRQSTQKIQNRKLKKMSNTDTTKKPEWTPLLAKGMQFLLHI